MEAEIREPSSQAELSRFRDEWLSEVAKSKRLDALAGNPDNERKSERRRDARAPIVAVPDTARRKDDFSEDFEPRAYHDLPDQESTLQLGSDGQRHDRAPAKEPSSALEHYEHAVEVSRILCRTQHGAVKLSCSTHADSTGTIERDPRSTWCFNNPLSQGFQGI